MRVASVSTITPPHTSDGFKTESEPFLPHMFFIAGSTCACGCYCQCKSITLFFSQFGHL